MYLGQAIDYIKNEFNAIIEKYQYHEFDMLNTNYKNIIINPRGLGKSTNIMMYLAAKSHFDTEETTVLVLPNTSFMNTLLYMYKESGVDLNKRTSRGFKRIQVLSASSFKVPEDIYHKIGNPNNIIFDDSINLIHCIDEHHLKRFDKISIFSSFYEKDDIITKIWNGAAPKYNPFQTNGNRIGENGFYRYYPDQDEMPERYWKIFERQTKMEKEYFVKKNRIELLGRYWEDE